MMLDSVNINNRNNIIVITDRNQKRIFGWYSILAENEIKTET